MMSNKDDKMLAEAYGHVYEPFSVLTEYRRKPFFRMPTKAGKARKGAAIDVTNDINTVSDRFYQTFGDKEPVSGEVFKNWLQQQMRDTDLGGSPAVMNIPDTVETKRGGWGMSQPMGISIIHDVVGDAHKLKLGGKPTRQNYKWLPRNQDIIFGR